MRPCRCQMKSSRTLSHSGSMRPGSCRSSRRGTARPSPTGWRPAMAARWPTWPHVRPSGWTRPIWLPDAHSLILLAANYNPGVPPPEWHDPAHGRIARYAWAADYHDVLKPRLYALDAFHPRAHGADGARQGVRGHRAAVRTRLRRASRPGLHRAQHLLDHAGAGLVDVPRRAGGTRGVDDGRETKDDSRSFVFRRSSAVAAAPAAWTPAQRVHSSARTSSMRGAASPI